MFAVTGPGSRLSSATVNAVEEPSSGASSA